MKVRSLGDMYCRLVYTAKSVTGVASKSGSSRTRRPCAMSSSISQVGM